jgi:hypothetical protein
MFAVARMLLEDGTFDVQAYGYKNLLSLEMCYESIPELTKEEEEEEIEFIDFLRNG